MRHTDHSRIKRPQRLKSLVQSQLLVLALAQSIKS